MCCLRYCCINLNIDQVLYFLTLSSITLLIKLFFFFFLSGWMKDTQAKSDISSGNYAHPLAFCWFLLNFSPSPTLQRNLKNQPFSKASQFFPYIGTWRFWFVREYFFWLNTHVEAVNAVLFHLNIYLWCNLTKGCVYWDSHLNLVHLTHSE